MNHTPSQHPSQPSHLVDDHQANSHQRTPIACLWALTAPKTHHYPSIDSDLDVDVCVIGAGYTGLSAAIHLAELGHRVCILEADSVGAGGSGRNVGYVNAGTWAQPDELNRLLGDSAGEKLTQMLGDAPRLVFDVIDKYAIDAYDTRTGNLHMAHNAKAESDIDARFAQLTRRGANVEILTGAKCREYTGTAQIKKALLDKRAGTIQPFAYVNGLGRAATDLGVRICEQTRAFKLTKINDARLWQLDASNVKGTIHTITADRVILAGNAYTQGEWQGIQDSFYHVEYFQIASEPLSGEAAESILPYQQGSWDTRIALSSIRRDHEGRLLLGTVGGQRFKTPRFYEHWANHIVHHYFPNLPKFDWQCQWFGRFGFTPDHIMRVFAPDEGLIAATAYNGRGITTGTLMGKCFAQFIDSDNPDVLPLPFYDSKSAKITLRHARETATEVGLTLYHAGQFLKIIT